MRLKEYFREKIYSKLLTLSIFIFALSAILSFSIYLKKLFYSMEEDIRNLKEVKIKIDKTEEFQRQVQKISFPEIEKNERAVTQLLDFLSSKFPQIKFNLSTFKKNGKELSYDLSIKGEGSFSNFSELINFIEIWKYPILFIKSIKISRKENILDFEIRCEIKVIEHEREKKV
ncbi:MAG: hypothetical protein NZ809_03115 [Thermodesulfovibrio sp.]|nr:hypothetical protein [Thermodesulfovibrio sp.]